MTRQRDRAMEAERSGNFSRALGGPRGRPGVVRPGRALRGPAARATAAHSISRLACAKRAVLSRDQVASTSKSSPWIDRSASCWPKTEPLVLREVIDPVEHPRHHPVPLHEHHRLPHRAGHATNLPPWQTRKIIAKHRSNSEPKRRPGKQTPCYSGTCSCRCYDAFKRINGIKRQRLK